MSKRRFARPSFGPLIIVVVLLIVLIIREGISLPAIHLPGIELPPIVITPGISVSVPITPDNPIVIPTSPGNPLPITGGIGQRTKTSGCVVNGALPDAACTPGAIFPNATKEQICTPGYSKNVRDVSTAEKNQVYAEYGITQHSEGQYEVDHLISLELGGSNDIANLWPEAAEPRPGFHEKDKVENYFHDQVCSGTVSLQQAQTEIANNWLNVYQRMPNK